MRTRVYLWLSFLVLAGAALGAALMARFMVAEMGGTFQSMAYPLPFGLRVTGIRWFAIFPITGFICTTVLHWRAADSRAAARIYAAIAFVVAIAVLVIALCGKLEIHELVV